MGYAFSIDIEDLFYSVSHCELFEAVGTCIDDSGVTAFHIEAGVTVDNFLTVQEAYLNSTFISFDCQVVFFYNKGGI